MRRLAIMTLSAGWALTMAAQLSACAEAPDSEALFKDAEASIDAGDLERASEMLVEAVRTDPEHWAAHCRLGEIYLAERRLREAEVELEAAVSLNPRSGQCLSRLSQAFLLDGDLARAEPYLVRASRFLPEDAGVIHNLARLYLLTDRPDAALQENLKLLEMAPEEEKGPLRLAVARLLRGLARNEEAVEHYESYLTGDPENHDVRSECADLLMGLSRHDDALAEYDRIIESGAAGAETLANAGALCILKMDLPRAIDLLERSILLDPGAIPPQLALATALYQTGEHERAVKVLEALTSVDPENNRAYALLGRSLRSLGRTDEARIAFQRHEQIHKALQADHVVGSSDR